MVIDEKLDDTKSFDGGGKFGRTNDKREAEVADFQMARLNDDGSVPYEDDNDSNDNSNNAAETKTLSKEKRSRN